MEKARLTKAEAEALDEHLNTMSVQSIISSYIGPSFPKTMNWNHIRDMNFKTLMQALVNGYEIIEPDQVVTVTAEIREDIINAMSKCTRDADFIWNQGAKYVLGKLGVKIDFSITEKSS